MHLATVRDLTLPTDEKNSSKSSDRMRDANCIHTTVLASLSSGLTSSVSGFLHITATRVFTTEDTVKPTNHVNTAGKSRVPILLLANDSVYVGENRKWLLLTSIHIVNNHINNNQNQKVPLQMY